MKITAVDAYVVLAPNYDAGFTSSAQDSFVVIIRTDDGVVGYGEACPVPAFTSETQRGIVELIESHATEMLNNHMTRVLAGPVDPAPSNDPAMLERALGNIDDAFAVVGVVERMDESMVAIAAALGWPSASQPGYENRTIDARRDVDPAARRAIEAANQLDLELYERMGERLAQRRH